MNHGFLRSSANYFANSVVVTKQAIIVLLIFVLLLAACRSPAQSVSEGGESRRAIQNKGSDTIVNIALAWAEEYRIVDPSVSIAVTGGGSGFEIASLIKGTIDIANASRPMKQGEIEDARAINIEPVEHIIAMDALAIIVDLDNPVSELTIQELSDIYTGHVTNWKEPILYRANSTCTRLAYRELLLPSIWLGYSALRVKLSWKISDSYHWKQKNKVANMPAEEDLATG
jgi:ABC-type phosphate transport system substrate-binding protein